MPAAPPVSLDDVISPLHVYFGKIDYSSKQNPSTTVFIQLRFESNLNPTGHDEKLAN